jgi:hypothetical protein
MKCSKCGLRLTRARDGYKSAVGTEEVERIEQWVCSNKTCERYCGDDLGNPTVVEQRISEKVETVTW